MSQEIKKKDIFVAQVALAILLSTRLYVVSGNFYVNSTRSFFFLRAVICYRTLLADVMSLLATDRHCQLFLEQAVYICRPR
jgi:hypothetical protein